MSACGCGTCARLVRVSMRARVHACVSECPCVGACVAFGDRAALVALTAAVTDDGVQTRLSHCRLDTPKVCSGPRLFHI